MNLISFATIKRGRRHPICNWAKHKNERKARHFCLIGFVFLLTGTNPVIAQSQQPTVITLSQAVQEAIEKNLNVLAERYNLSVADAKIITARQRPNPVFSLEAGHLTFLVPNGNPAAAGPNEYAARTDFAIERGGKRDKRIEVAQQARAVVELQLLNTVRFLVTDVQNAAVDVLQAKANLELANENLQFFKRIVQINEARVGDGDLAPIELTRSRLTELQLSNAAIQAQLQVRAARTKLQLLIGRTERAADLFGHNAIAQKEVVNASSALQQAKAGVDAANAGVESAKAAREQARERLRLLGLKENEAKRQVTVRAPLSGKVLDISVVAGEYRNDTSAPVMTIADLGTVWMASDIPETSVRLIHAGEGVEITFDAYPSETFHGRVTRLADTLDSKTRTLQAMIELNNSNGRFRPEMFGSVRLAQASREMPVLPIGAVIQEGGRNVVYVEKAKGRFEQREVVTATRVGESVAIVSGISAGERVVVDGVMLLRS